MGRGRKWRSAVSAELTTGRKRLMTFRAFKWRRRCNIRSRNGRSHHSLEGFSAPGTDCRVRGVPTPAVRAWNIAYSSFIVHFARHVQCSAPLMPLTGEFHPHLTRIAAKIHAPGVSRSNLLPEMMLSDFLFFPRKGRRSTVNKSGRCCRWQHSHTSRPCHSRESGNPFSGSLETERQPTHSRFRGNAPGLEMAQIPKDTA